MHAVAYLGGKSLEHRLLPPLSHNDPLDQLLRFNRTYLLIFLIGYNYWSLYSLSFRPTLTPLAIPKLNIQIKNLAAPGLQPMHNLLASCMYYVFCLCVVCCWWFLINWTVIYWAYTCKCSFAFSINVTRRLYCYYILQKDESCHHNSSFSHHRYVI